jgi:hypothetical protein
MTEDLEPRIKVLFGGPFCVSVKMKVLCEAHTDGFSGDAKRPTVFSEGMITERGLICPVCYKHVKFLDAGAIDWNITGGERP